MHRPRRRIIAARDQGAVEEEVQGLHQAITKVD
jgi:hypothetical protein